MGSCGALKALGRALRDTRARRFSGRRAPVLFALAHGPSAIFSGAPGGWQGSQVPYTFFHFEIEESAIHRAAPAPRACAARLGREGGAVEILAEQGASRPSR